MRSPRRPRAARRPRCGPRTRSERAARRRAALREPAGEGGHGAPRARAAASGPPSRAPDPCRRRWRRSARRCPGPRRPALRRGRRLPLRARRADAATQAAAARGRASPAGRRRPGPSPRRAPRAPPGHAGAAPSAGRGSAAAATAAAGRCGRDRPRRTAGCARRATAVDGRDRFGAPACADSHGLSRLGRGLSTAVRDR